MEESELPRLTIDALLDRQSEAFGDNACVAWADRDINLSYAKFRERVHVIARGLMGLGIRKAEHVAVWAPNVPEWLFLQYATAKIGAILVPIDTECTADELDFVLRHSETTTLFLNRGADGGSVAKLRSLLPGLDEAPVGHAHFESLPRLSRLLFIGKERLPGMLRFDDLGDLAVQTHPDDCRRRSEAGASFDVINLQYDCAGPSQPKGAMLTHRNIILNAWHVSARQGITEDDRVCIPAPFFHPIGSIAGSVGSVVRGACMIPVEKFDAAGVVETIRQMRCSAECGFPWMFAAQVDALRASGELITGLRTGLIAPAPLPADLARTVAEKMGAKAISVGFGVPETTAVIAQTEERDDAEHRFTTTGRAITGVGLKVVDARSGSAVSTGSSGELCCRGHALMKGYFKDPAASASAHDEEGWLHTKVVAAVDRDGFVRVLGRIEEPIVRDGAKIDPAAIENFLLGYPTIAQVHVIGVPNKAVGEDACAVVRLQPGETASDVEILEFCRGRLDEASLPNLVMFVQSFPLTAAGAVKRRALRAMAIEHFGRQEDAAVVTA